MQSTNTKQIKYWDFLILFLASCLPRILIALTSHLGFWPADEVATLAGAATLAGYDWSAVISKAGYYGQGFYSLFAPIFLLTDNPFMIYRVIAVVCALLQGSIAFFAYHCLKHDLHVENHKIVLFTSIACSYMLNTEASILYNEHPYLLVCWLIVFILFQLHAHIEHRGQKAFYTVALILVLSYAITLHTRAWTLWLALGCTVFLYYRAYGKCFLSLPVCIGLGTCLLIGIVTIISRIQNTLWLHNGTEVLRNAGISLSNISLDSLTGVHAWLNIILGQINTAAFASFGASVLCMVIFLPMLFRALCKKEILPDRNIMLEQQFVLIGTFFFTAVIITIGGLSLTWLNDATTALRQGVGGTSVTRKIFLYFRYFAPYTGPLLLLLFTYFYHYKQELRKHGKPAAILFILLQIYWFAFVVPYVYRFQEYKAFRFSPYVLFLFGQKVNLATFILASVVLAIAWVIIWMFLRKGSVTVPIALITVFLVYHYMSMTFCYVKPLQEQRYAQINGGYEFVHMLEENNIAIPVIYAPADVYHTRCPFYYYQFYLNRYTIIPEYPDETCQSAIVFYDKPQNELLLDLGYRYTKLDDNEYLYCNNKALRKIIKTFGYQFKR